MEDQIRFEQRRFENLKTAIIKDEEDSSFMYQPQINRKSVSMVRKKMRASSIENTSQETSLSRMAKRKQDYLNERE